MDLKSHLRKNSLYKNNILFIIIISFLFLFSLSPSLYGQSKKKTMQWINTNGVSLSKIENQTSNQDDSSLYFSILEVDKDRVYYISNCNNDSNSKAKHSILLKDILYEDVSTLEIRNNSCFYNITNFVIKIRSISNQKNGKNKKIETVSDFYFPFKDEDKATRVIKSILDLARLNGAKENKQYY